jgi:hypothetical protein
MDDIQQLLKVVDAVMIAAIIGIVQGLKKVLHEDLWRWIPLAVIVLGVLAGWITTDTGAWRAVAKNALLYAGAASIIYELGRTTVFAKGAKGDK